MKITNRTKVEHVIDGINVKPGETYDSGDGVEKTAISGDDGIETARAEYRELTGKDADGRWKEDRIRAEIDKALEA